MEYLGHRTAMIRRLFDDEATFLGLPSGYYVPPHVMPVLRQAERMRREVKITVDEACNIYAAEILPPPPSAFTRVAQAFAAMLSRRRQA